MAQDGDSEQRMSTGEPPTGEPPGMAAHQAACGRKQDYKVGGTLGSRVTGSGVQSSAGLLSSM